MGHKLKQSSSKHQLFLWCLSALCIFWGAHWFKGLLYTDSQLPFFSCQSLPGMAFLSLFWGVVESRESSSCFTWELKRSVTVRAWGKRMEGGVLIFSLAKDLTPVKWPGEVCGTLIGQRLNFTLNSHSGWPSLHLGRTELQDRQSFHSNTQTEAGCALKFLAVFHSYSIFQNQLCDGTTTSW